MNEGRRQRDRLPAKRTGKKPKEKDDPAEEDRKLSRRALELGLVPINRAKLHSRSVMGCLGVRTLGGRFYLDHEFTCKDCGKTEVWTGRQQKWWYEVARGEMEQVAVRCRSCRQKENRRKEEARRAHLEGLERKSRTKRGGS
jgi:hypothetical protein